MGTELRVGKRERLTKFKSKYGSNDLKAMVDDAGLLAKQVLVLDDHISRGGALPKQWQKATPK